MFPALLMLSLLQTNKTPASVADSARYRIEVTLDQKATAGTASQVSQTKLTGFLTMHLADTTGGRVARFRIDSLLLAPGNSTPPSLQGSTTPAKGLVYQAMIVRGIPIGGFRLSAPQAHANLLTTALDNLFPGLKPSIAMGDHWSDTISVNSVPPVVEDRTTIIAWHVTGLNQGIATVEATITGTSLSKTQTANGERVTQGTMTGHRELSGPISGPMTAGTIVSDQPMTTSLAGGPPVTILAKTIITMTRLP